MALYGSQRDVSLIRHINRELIADIITLLESPIKSELAMLSKLLFANLRYLEFLLIRKFLGIFLIDVNV